MPYREKISCIYVIRRKDSEECYVGQTVNFHHRWAGHKRHLLLDKHQSRRMQRVANKYGIDAFECCILEVVPVTEHLRRNLSRAEQHWIDTLQPCYNSALVAESTLGVKFSEESRINVSIAQKKRFSDPEARRLAGVHNIGRPSHWRGTTLSPEHNEKFQAGRIRNPPAFLGKTHTEEAKAKMSATRKGRQSPNKGKPRDPEASAKQAASMKAMYDRKRSAGIPIGHPVDEATRKKISATKKAKLAGNPSQ